jgi:hypothetical protein
VATSLTWWKPLPARCAAESINRNWSCKQSSACAEGWLVPL